MTTIRSMPGQSWSGDLPDGWAGHRAKRIFAQRKDRALSSDEQLSVTQRQGVVPQQSFMKTEGQKVVLALTGTENFKHVEKNDFVISLRSFQGGIEWSAFSGCVSPAYTVLRATIQIDPTYWAYLFKSSVYITALRSVIDEGIRDGKSITYEQFGETIVPLPPTSEQKSIASYLDRTTVRIDSLVAKKTRFIGLLRERRETLVLRAVTRGLDDGVSMKESGIKWLGKVPTTWKIIQLGRITESRCDGPFGSGLKSDHYTPTGVRVIRLQNIGWAEFKDGNAAFIDHDHWIKNLGGGHEVQPGDLLIAGLGDEKNPLGRACVAPADIGQAIVKADCYRFRLNKLANPKFVALALSATAAAECGFLAAGATRDRLNLGLASSRKLAIPPIEEQRSIVANLDRATTRIDTLLAKTERSIELLREHRTALITSAVTGKIDLREGA